jgi:hypothetical protein
MNRITAQELKPSELRIGNYAIKNKTGEQHALSANDIANFAHSTLMQPMFSPIELTEEWLKRMGFEEHKSESEECRSYKSSITGGPYIEAVVSEGFFLITEF